MGGFFSRRKEVKNMDKEIKLSCCEGRETSYGYCLKDRCPNYHEAKEYIDRHWPYTGTGYGNLYGWPTHSIYLAQVRRWIDPEKES